MWKIVFLYTSLYVFKSGLEYSRNIFLSSETHASKTHLICFNLTFRLRQQTLSCSFFTWNDENVQCLESSREKCARRVYFRFRAERKKRTRTKNAKKGNIFSLNSPHHFGDDKHHTILSISRRNFHFILICYESIRRENMWVRNGTRGYNESTVFHSLWGDHFRDFLRRFDTKILFH